MLEATAIGPIFLHREVEPGVHTKIQDHNAPLGSSKTSAANSLPSGAENGNAGGTLVCLPEGLPQEPGATEQRTRSLIPAPGREEVRTGKEMDTQKRPRDVVEVRGCWITYAVL